MKDEGRRKPASADKRLRLLAALVLPILVGLAAGAQTPASRPSRIVCLIPALTETLFAIGAGGQVAAVSSFDNHPPEVLKLERVGALLDPDLEKILALRPDLVVVYGSQKDLRTQLGRAAIPQFVYSHGGLSDALDTMRQLGERVGRDAEARRLVASLEDDLAAIRHRVAGRPRPRTLVVFGRETGALRGIFASGGYGFIHDMLEAAGGINVFADVNREAVQATTELIIARKPDVILELRSIAMSDDALARERATWSVLSSVPAVRSRRVEIIVDALTTIPGPRLGQATGFIARALHPDAFR